MATLSQIRADLATRLAAITGLTAYAQIPDMVDEPAAVVGMPEEVLYDLTFSNTFATWTIPVRLYVGRADAEAAQDLLNPYLASTGTQSIKRAVEDRTVAITSGWHVVRVAAAREFGVYRVGDVDYLGCEITVEVVV